MPSASTTLLSGASSMPRDSQRSKVYRAERAAFATNNGRFPIEFKTVKQAQAFVNRVTKSAFWIEAEGRSFVHLKPVPHRQYARGGERQIEIPPWAMNRAVILHELAHALLLQVDWQDDSHGPGFVLIYRRLLEQHVSDEARRLFDAYADVENVKSGLTAALKRRLA